MEPEAGPLIQFVDGPGGPLDESLFSREERVALNCVNQRVAGSASLGDIMNFVFDATRGIFPCDRIGLALVEEEGYRLRSYWVRATYAPLLLDTGYIEDLHDSSLEVMLRTGRVRIINDLQQYLESKPASRATEMLVREGVRSSMTCPLLLDGRSVGLLFRSSRQPNAYNEHQVRLHLALAERLSQAVEKAYRIEQLTAATHAYREMLTFISHELKNPLASLAMDATVLAEGYLGSLEERQVAKIIGMRRKAEHVLGLVRDYLTLARIEDPVAKAEMVPVADLMQGIVQPAVELLREDAKAKGMTIEIQRHGTGPIPCRCDPELLKTAVINLISNAVKYGEEQIRVSVHHDGEFLRISVWNKGAGFSGEEKARLFRKFSRLESKAFRRAPGTGIGLYTAWRIARLHDARITAESEEGAWAAFTIWLPQSEAGECAATGSDRCMGTPEFTRTSSLSSMST